MFESNMLQQCTLLLVIIINISILLQIIEHVEYLNQKANPEIVYRSGFDWVVSVAWTKSQFIYMCTISIAPPVCVLLQVDTREYIQTDVSACTNPNKTQSLKTGKYHSYNTLIISTPWQFSVIAEFFKQLCLIQQKRSSEKLVSIFYCL